MSAFVSFEQVGKIYKTGELEIEALHDVNFEIEQGEFCVIVGASGAGKTTILKIINNLLPADAGTVTLGSNVYIGYYDQEHAVLHMEKTIFEEISDAYPSCFSSIFIYRG